MYEVNFYEDAEGRKPVADFIASLDTKMKAKVLGRIGLLEEYGSNLGMPYARHLDDGIYELRAIQGSNITRVLYFFVVDRQVIMTNGFVKKTQKTPRRELDKAKKARDDWRNSHE